jgi:hypothetical protein
MSSRKALTMRIALAVRTGLSGVPDTTLSSAVLGMPSSPTPVMTCGKPSAPGMKLP